MKYLISLLSYWLMFSYIFCDVGNWCIKETNVTREVTTYHTKIVTARKFFGGIKRRTVTYTATQIVPRIIQQRVCCSGYTLNRWSRSCEPYCPGGCPSLSVCRSPNTCECRYGYEMKENRCVAKCHTDCDFCKYPFSCFCEIGLKYNNLTNSCYSPTEFEATSTPTSTLTDFTTLSLLDSETTTQQTFTTTTDPPTTVATTEVVKEPSSTSTTLTEPPTTEEPETSVILNRKNEICYYGYSYFCQCIEGYVKVDWFCSLKFGHRLGECVEENLCMESTTEMLDFTSTSSEETSSSENQETTSATPQTENIPSSCASECSNGYCVNGLCQCPVGFVLNVNSNSCVMAPACDAICHNGICQENGICECSEGFVYQYNKGCVRSCSKNCINGICDSRTGKCKCHDGFDVNVDNSFECMPLGKFSEKLKTQSYFYMPWVWIPSTVVIVAILSVLVFKMKKSRKQNYNVEKGENVRHFVQFENKACETI